MLTTMLLMMSCAKRVPPTMQPDATLTVQTDDGWTLPIRRYAADGPPVLLVHGMGVTHHNFDYHPDVSLADHLQDAGFDVWVPALRGDPGTVAPSREAERQFTFDEYARRDVPAILDLVTEVTGYPAVRWVGHSMGGILLYTTLQQRPEQIVAGVAVSSPATFEEKNILHRGTIVGARLMVRNRRMRMAWAGALALPRGVVARQLGNVHNMDRGITRGLAAHSLVDLTTTFSRQAGRWLDSGVLLDQAEEPWLTQGPPVPLLVFGSDHDRIVPAGNAAQACAVFPTCEFVLLSPENGFSTHFGHIDPLLSEPGRTEVYPRITDFLLMEWEEEHTAE